MIASGLGDGERDRLAAPQELRRRVASRRSSSVDRRRVASGATLLDHHEALLVEVAHLRVVEERERPGVVLPRERPCSTDAVPAARTVGPSGRESAGSRSQHWRPVHLAERIIDQFEPCAVRVAEVDRCVALDVVVDVRLVELARRCVQRSGSTEMREMMETAELAPGSRARSKPGRSKNASRFPWPMSKKK